MQVIGDDDDDNDVSPAFAVSISASVLVARVVTPAAASWMVSGSPPETVDAETGKTGWKGVKWTV